MWWDFGHGDDKPLLQLVLIGQLCRIPFPSFRGLGNVIQSLLIRTLLCLSPVKEVQGEWGLSGPSAS